MKLFKCKSYIVSCPTFTKQLNLYFFRLKQGNRFHKVVQDTKRYTKDYAKHQKSGNPAIRRSDLEELKIKTRTTHLSGIDFDIQEVALEVKNNQNAISKLL